MRATHFWNSYSGRCSRIWEKTVRPRFIPHSAACSRPGPSSQIPPFELQIEKLWHPAIDRVLLAEVSCGAPLGVLEICGKEDVPFLPHSTALSRTARAPDR